MALSVKQLIKELEKIENQFLEVECIIADKSYVTFEIEKVEKGKKKVLLFTRNYRNE